MSVDQLIRITSWNVAGQEPVNGTLEYLFDDSKKNLNLHPDIQIVGLQEAPQYLFSDPWTTNLSHTLNKRGYILFKRHKLSGILLYIFVLRSIMLRARDFETESVKTGFGGLLGNKGGVSLRFCLNGISFSVTNSHLAAHQENLQQRVMDYNSILSGTKFLIDSKTSDILNHSYSFWFGDLNFRFDDIEKGKVMNIITAARTSSSREDELKIISELKNHDQLNSVRKKGLAFKEFEENPPTFLPTYKFQMGEKFSYDSEKRTPAWTDRVLFRMNPSVSESTALAFKQDYKQKLEQLYYDALPDISLSDHKPVVSLFRVSTFDPVKFNPSPTPYEVVKFEPIRGWKTSSDGVLWYKVSNEIFYRRPKVLSSWDKLALYKADFVSLEDYLTIVFANNIARLEPRNTAQEVPYQSSAPSSRAVSPTNSRRGSTSSNASTISVGVEALSLNDTGLQPSQSNQPYPPMAVQQIETLPLPNDAIIGDGFKYFTVTFPDEALLAGKHVILYLKTTSANEYNVYGVSDPFTIEQN